MAVTASASGGARLRLKRATKQPSPAKRAGSKEARVKKRAASEQIAVSELSIDLNGPGMTPLLRAGVGGLASALRGLARERDLHARWPAPLSLADGTAVVEPRRIVFRFGSSGAKPFLDELFERTFRITPEGVISPVGISDGAIPLGLAIALQDGWKRTFLQHGKATKKAGSTRVLQTEIDEQQLRYSLQPFAWYQHQAGGGSVAGALPSHTVKLAGWAYPGAAQLHQFPDTKCDYTAAQALSAMFALVGCLSFPTARGGRGVLVVPVPDDLVAFSETRPHLTPKKVADVYVAGVGDAVLAMTLALKLADIADCRRGIKGATGVLLQTLPWARQQKSRAWTLEAGAVSDRRLDAYADIVQTLPSKVRGTGGLGENGQGADGFFVATSAFRGFVADNLAQNRAWFTGFATATTGGKKPRYLHYFRDRESGLGALYPEEKKGIIAMIGYLESSEQQLVASVHLALRGRFARIAKEAKEAQDARATMTNRFKSERERLRLAFANAKTPDQIRAALADLWSRGGPNKELQQSWRDLLPLLRPEHWQVARDLALVALASYQSANRIEDGDADTAIDHEFDDEVD